MNHAYRILAPLAILTIACACISERAYAAAPEWEIELADGTTVGGVTLMSLDGDSLAVASDGRLTKYHIANIDDMEEEITNWWVAGGFGAATIMYIAVPLGGDFEASNSGAGIALAGGLYLIAFALGAVVVGQLTGDKTYDLSEMDLEARRKQVYDLVMKSK